MLNKKFNPVLEQEEFEHLHEKCDRARSTSKNVTVNKQALEHLLMDHSSLWALAGIRDE